MILDKIWEKIKKNKEDKIIKIRKDGIEMIKTLDNKKIFVKCKAGDLQCQQLN